MPATGVRSVFLAIVVGVALLSASPPPTCHATHNITAILSGHRDLAAFSRALTSTGLTDDINGRNTITVLAVDDAHMAPLLLTKAPREALRRVFSLHVLVDYYDDAKLRRLPGGSEDASTLFQASGDAPGSAGMIRISDLRGGRVAFDAGAGPAVFYVRPVHETPYNISVLLVSGVILASPAAEAPVSTRHNNNNNVSDVLSKQNGCGRFARLVTATGDAAAMYDESVQEEEGFTVFCPDDKAVAAFEPTFEKLPDDARLAVVLYHGMLGHYSVKALEANHRDLQTLAWDREDYYLDCAERHFDDGTVTLVSASSNAARVTRLLVDADPVAVYMIDAVLVPYNLTAPPHPGPSDADASSGGNDGHHSDSSLCSPCLLLFSLLMAFALR